MIRALGVIYGIATAGRYRLNIPERKFNEFMGIIESYRSQVVAK
jgi:hypothetical protein